MYIYFCVVRSSRKYLLLLLHINRVTDVELADVLAKYDDDLFRRLEALSAVDEGPWLLEFIYKIFSPIFSGKLNSSKNENEKAGLELVQLCKNVYIHATQVIIL